MIDGVIACLREEHGIIIDTTGRQRIEMALPHLATGENANRTKRRRGFFDPGTKFSAGRRKGSRFLSTAVSRSCAIQDSLGEINAWDAETLELALRARGEELELGFGKIAQPLRAALCGSSASPGIFDVLVILDRDESLARIQRAVEQE